MMRPRIPHPFEPGHPGLAHGQIGLDRRQGDIPIFDRDQLILRLGDDAHHRLGLLGG